MVGNLEYHADFEFPWRQPSGEVKEPVRCAGLELRREVSARDANLSLQSSTSSSRTSSLREEDGEEKRSGPRPKL